MTSLYAGAGAAILASIAAAFLLEQFNNGAHNDMVEAVVILFAAALMLYVSGWLMLRQDPRAWQGFLKDKADAALAKQTHWAVASLAFLAVFREGQRRCCSFTPSPKPLAAGPWACFWA